MNPLVEYYKELLTAFGCSFDEDGTILYGPKQEPLKVRINGKWKTLMLPLDSVIKNGGFDKIAIFHPASESIMAGQSEIINTLVTLAGWRIYENVQRAVFSIINLGINTQVHGKLRLHQTQLLQQFDILDASVEKVAKAVSDKTTELTGKWPLMALRFDRGGVIDDESYLRTCHLVPYILNDKDTLCGVTQGGVKAKKVVRELYEYVFPKKRDWGSNSKHTPYLFSLLEAYHDIAVHLNDIKTLLGKYSNMYEIPVEWYEHMRELPKLAKTYLPQPYAGNVGRTEKQMKEDEELVERKGTTREKPSREREERAAPTSSARSREAEQEPVAVAAKAPTEKKFTASGFPIVAPIAERRPTRQVEPERERERDRDRERESRYRDEEPERRHVRDRRYHDEDRYEREERSRDRRPTSVAEQIAASSRYSDERGYRSSRDDRGGRYDRGSRMGGHGRSEYDSDRGGRGRVYR